MHAFKKYRPLVFRFAPIQLFLTVKSLAKNIAERTRYLLFIDHRHAQPLRNLQNQISLCLILRIADLAVAHQKQRGIRDQRFEVVGIGEKIQLVAQSQPVGKMNIVFSHKYRFLYLNLCYLNGTIFLSSAHLRFTRLYSLTILFFAHSNILRFSWVRSGWFFSPSNC